MTSGGKRKNSGRLKKCFNPHSLLITIEKEDYNFLQEKFGKGKIVEAVRMWIKSLK